MSAEHLILLAVGFFVGVWVGWLGGAFMMIASRQTPRIPPRASGLSTERRRLSSAVQLTELRRVK